MHHHHWRGLVAHIGRAQDRRGHGRLLRAADVRDTAGGDDGEKNCTMSYGCSEVTPDSNACPDHPLIAPHDVPFFPGFYSAGLVVRVHAASDAVWRLERRA